VPAVPPPPVVDAALALRRVLLRAADSLLPPWAAVWDRTMGVVRTEIIGVLASLGVADELADGPLTASELAARLDVDADALHRVMRVASADGLFKLDRRGRFRLTRFGKTLRSDSPATLRPWARYMALDSTRRAWADLGDSVRTGRSAFERVNGSSIWDWFAAHPEEQQLFAAAMRSITEFDGPGLAGSELVPDEGVVCDVAGGAGTLLGEVLVARPRLRGVLLEARGVLAEAEKHLSSRGVLSRVELVEGDLFGEMSADADLYLMKSILHDWDDPTCAGILSRVQATMKPGSRLVLVEQLQERNEPHPFTSLSDVQMLTQCVDGRERSLSELQGLLSDAGLKPGRTARAGVSSMIEGVAGA
jgi:O-methyltransferase domain